MAPSLIRSLKAKLRYKRKPFRKILTMLKGKPPHNLDKIATKVDKEVWKEIDCLVCANCCKVMTPTFTETDIKRISSHLEMTIPEFKKKWVKKDRTGDIVNKTTPCQFLNLKNNMCNIYEVRPADCAGFPHLAKKKMVDFIHIHKQNIEFCPATFKMVEKMTELFKK